MSSRLIQWVLRIAVAGEFIGHGVFALQQKGDWVKWMGQLIGTSPEVSGQLIFLVGLFDLLIALIVLLRPIPAVLLWAAFWGFWTALVRPLVGMPIWDFVERWANWGAPLALLLMIGWPRTIRGWFTTVK